MVLKIYRKCHVRGKKYLKSAAVNTFSQFVKLSENYLCAHGTNVKMVSEKGQILLRGSLKYLFSEKQVENM